MKEIMKVSVIVSVYNTERVLERTLNCIANQTYRDLEIILVDDGSTDSSGIICDTFAKQDSRCTVIHKPNGGQGSAKNAGQAVATGDYLFFPDSDDTFNLDMVRILIEAISKNQEYDIAISGMDDVSDWNSDITPLDFAEDTINCIEYSKDDLIQGLFSKYDNRFVFGWNKLYKRELLDNIWCGDYPRHQDFDFNYRVFLQTRKSVFVDLPLYHWVHWSESKTSQSDTWDIYYKCRTFILYNNWDNLTPDNSKYEHYLLDALYKAMVFWEEWSRKSGNFKEVRSACSNYRKRTLWAYLKNPGISIIRKITCLILLSFPAFAHFVMRATKNAR